MSRIQIAAVLAVAGAALLAWQLGGRAGAGALGGTLLGAATALLGHARLARSLGGDFEACFKALAIAAAAKVAVLVAAWALLVNVPALSNVAAVEPFVLGFAASAALLLVVGSFDHLRALRGAEHGVAEQGEAAS